MDIIVEEVMFEIKARAAIGDVGAIQTLSYLKASGFQVGLLLNFVAKSLEIKRLINTSQEGPPKCLISEIISLSVLVVPGADR